MAAVCNITGSFDVTATCAENYEGNATVAACTTAGPYTLSGCEPIVCSTRGRQACTAPRWPARPARSYGAAPLAAAASRLAVPSSSAVAFDSHPAVS